MRTPYGAECKFYYEDFNRGRSRQECRLLERQPGARWSPDLCRACPVPRILLANACAHLTLHAKITSGFFGLGRRVELSASCAKTGERVSEPAIGCGQCHASDTPLKFELPD